MSGQGQDMAAPTADSDDEDDLPLAKAAPATDCDEDDEQPDSDEDDELPLRKLLEVSATGGNGSALAVVKPHGEVWKKSERKVEYDEFGQIEPDSNPLAETKADFAWRDPGPVVRYVSQKKGSSGHFE